MKPSTEKKKDSPPVASSSEWQTTSDDNTDAEFKKPASVSTPPVQKKIKKKKKTICRCNASFDTIQKILEAVEYQVLAIMKEDPEKAGSVMHLLEDDFAPKLDAIHEGFMTPERKAQRTCLAKKHEFLFWDTLSKLDAIYGL